MLQVLVACIHQLATLDYCSVAFVSIRNQPMIKIACHNHQRQGVANHTWTATTFSKSPSGLQPLNAGDRSVMSRQGLSLSRAVRNHSKVLQHFFTFALHRSPLPLAFLRACSKCVRKGNKKKIVELQAGSYRIDILNWRNARDPLRNTCLSINRLHLPFNSRFPRFVALKMRCNDASVAKVRAVFSTDVNGAISLGKSLLTPHFASFA